MNKLQYIELLRLRGITELRGWSIATALSLTGGDPTEAEMIKVNRNILNNERRKKLEKISNGI